MEVKKINFETLKRILTEGIPNPYTNEDPYWVPTRFKKLKLNELKNAIVIIYTNGFVAMGYLLIYDIYEDRYCNEGVHAHIQLRMYPINYLDEPIYEYGFNYYNPESGGIKREYYEFKELIKNILSKCE